MNLRRCTDFDTVATPDFKEQTPAPESGFRCTELIIETDVENTSHRILIVDDNPPNRELLEAYLGDIDCEIDVAEDGQEAMEKATSFKPDLILLDVMMPKLSGFEVCRKIKDDPALSNIMVLMVTALNELGDIERAIDAGTNDFLSKPVNRVELIKRVENMLQLKGVTDENERLRQYIQRIEDDAPTGIEK